MMDHRFDLDFIKKRREQLGLSRAEVATALGITNTSTYWKYENGTYKFKAETLPTLSKALQCDPRDFFCPDLC